MGRPFSLLFALGMIAFAACAQQFEVVSITPCENTDRPKAVRSPGRLDLACVTTANLIRLAFLVFPTGAPNGPVSYSAFRMPISGGPSWINSDRYRISAKADRPINFEMMQGPMLQALLEDRFKLKLHHETKPIDVYELTVAKSGAKLRRAKQGGCTMSEADAGKPPCGSIILKASGGFDLFGITMTDFCHRLSAYVDQDIIDKTGLTGVFDLHLDLTPADLGYPDAVPDPSSPFTPGDGGAIALAVEKLGLRLRSAKGSAQFVVVDHVERPSED